MSVILTAAQIYQRGYTELVCVVPPGAPIAPESTLKEEALGKVPGRLRPDGKWAGEDWLGKPPPTPADLERWRQWGANTGLMAEHYPAFDIDCLDAALTEWVIREAHRLLGPAPIRIGLAPKALLIYRLEGPPIGHLSLQAFPEGKPRHVFEWLGRKQQYLLSGIHPSGRPYQFEGDLPPASKLTPVTEEQIFHFMTELQDFLDLFFPTKLSVPTNPNRVTVDQDELLAPSLQQLKSVVSSIPNRTEDLRDFYINMGIAIKAAWKNEAEAFHVFEDWAGKHTGSDRVEGNPDTWANDWQRFRSPYRIGYDWLVAKAREHGYGNAPEELPALEGPAPETPPSPVSKGFTDDELGEAVVSKHHATIRRTLDQWWAFRQGRWVRDTLSTVEDITRLELRILAEAIARQGATTKEKRESRQRAEHLRSQRCRKNVLAMMQTDPRVTCQMEDFDQPNTSLNTPAGPHRPEDLITRITAVSPAIGAACPLFTQYLLEATRNDTAYVRYLWQILGYILTGEMKEQVFWLLYGPSGTGKSVFTETVSKILGSYAVPAVMETFITSHNDRHPTELARFHGARLVTASETIKGRHWNAALIKKLTSGEKIAARFMRENFFEFQPQCKFLFSSNYKPDLSGMMDSGLQRRLRILPFMAPPLVDDKDLKKKLIVEWPAILGRMLEGREDWETNGFVTPEVVLEASAEFFEEQDAGQPWLDSCIGRDPNARASKLELWISWREYAGPRGELDRIKSMQALTRYLKDKGFTEKRMNNWRGFLGIYILPNNDPGVL